MTAVGEAVPDFSLVDEGGERRSRDEILDGRRTVFVFFPNAFSPVCTDQFQVYDEALEDVEAAGARMVGVSCDQSWTLREFRDRLGVRIPMYSDFEPKGEVSRALGAWFEPAGFSHRALVILDPGGVVRWRHVADSPGDLPGVNVVFDGLAAVADGGA